MTRRLDRGRKKEGKEVLHERDFTQDKVSVASLLDAVASTKGKSDALVPAVGGLSRKGDIDAADLWAIDRALAHAKPAGQRVEVRRVDLGGGSRREPGENVARLVAAATRDPGSDIPYRAEIEQAFATDLGKVRAHVGPHAKAAAKALDAEAFTAGNRVFFRTANPARATAAHEAAHAIQQGLRTTGGLAPLQPSSHDLEKEAQAASAAFLAGDTPMISAGVTAPAVFRQLIGQERIGQDHFVFRIMVDTTYDETAFETDIVQGLDAYLPATDVAEILNSPEFRRSLTDYYHQAFGRTSMHPGDRGMLNVLVTTDWSEDGQRTATLSEAPRAEDTVDFPDPLAHPERRARTRRQGEVTRSPEVHDVDAVTATDLEAGGVEDPRDRLRETETPSSFPETATPRGPASARIYQPTDTSRESALQELERRGYLVGSAPLRWSRWNDRPRTREAREHAQTAVPRLREELERLQEEQRPRQEEYDRLRHTRPRTTEQSQRMAELNRQIRRTRFRIQEIQSNLREMEPLLSDTPPASMGNEGAVQVNLTRSGVAIYSARGRVQPPSEWRLDPVWALAMANFLEDVHGLGVTRMYSAGFLRTPMSAEDTHPRGLACDITGFRVNGEDIELRSGSPGQSTDMSRARGHSDWFDEDSHTFTGGPSHAATLRQIVERMRAHFGQVVGPGRNAEHMGHFHVQLVGYQGRSGAVMAPATPDNPFPFRQQRGRSGGGGGR